MGRNMHELNKNLKDLVSERELWCAALKDSNAPFVVINVVGAHTRELDRRIKNLHYLIDEPYRVCRRLFYLS